MGLDIFFLEDIRNAILAANEASSSTAAVVKDRAISPGQEIQMLDVITAQIRAMLPEGESQVLLDALHAAAVGNVDTMKHYRHGYRAALTTLALAFGLSPAIVDGQDQGPPPQIQSSLTIPVRERRQGGGD